MSIWGAGRHNLNILMDYLQIEELDHDDFNNDEDLYGADGISLWDTKAGYFTEAFRDILLNAVRVWRAPKELRVYFEMPDGQRKAIRFSEITHPDADVLELFLDEVWHEKYQQ